MDIECCYCRKWFAAPHGMTAGDEKAVWCTHCGKTMIVMAALEYTAEPIEDFPDEYGEQHHV